MTSLREEPCLERGAGGEAQSLEERVTDRRHRHGLTPRSMDHVLEVYLSVGGQVELDRLASQDAFDAE
jgi:hypothetical protein